MMELQSKKKDLADLVESVNLQSEDTYIFLTEESTEEFRLLVKEWMNKDVFARHNLTIRSKILMHGESGNGKTSAAKFLARRADIPMYRVRHERIIDAYLGATGKNIADLFDGLNQLTGHSLVLFDEIDSITLKRGEDQRESSAGEEYNKALNVFLIKLEQLRSDIIFVAATNRFGAMDAAVIRRFDFLHQMPPPTNNEKKPFIERHLKHYKVEFDDDVISTLYELKSFSDIKREIQYHARKKILQSLK